MSEGARQHGWLTRLKVGLARSSGKLGAGISGIFTKRRLDTDPAEQRSLGWAFYLTAALIGSLVTTMSVTTAFLGEWLADGDLDRALLISALLWGGVWAGHWWIAQRAADPDRMQIHLLLGSAAGLVAVLVGEALEHVRRGLKLASHREKPYLFMGRRYKAIGRADVAEKMFTRAVQILPECVEALRELRLIHMRREKSKGVIGRLLRR